jgi:hypothetical protein
VYTFEAWSMVFLWLARQVSLIRSLCHFVWRVAPRDMMDFRIDLTMMLLHSDFVDVLFMTGLETKKSSRTKDDISTVPGSLPRL